MVVVARCYISSLLLVVSLGNRQGFMKIRLYILQITNACNVDQGFIQVTLRIYIYICIYTDPFGLMDSAIVYDI